MGTRVFRISLITLLAASSLAWAAKPKAPVPVREDEWGVRTGMLQYLQNVDRTSDGVGDVYGYMRGHDIQKTGSRFKSIKVSFLGRAQKNFVDFAAVQSRILNLDWFPKKEDAAFGGVDSKVGEVRLFCEEGYYSKDAKLRAETRQKAEVRVVYPTDIQKAWAVKYPPMARIRIEIPCFYDAPRIDAVRDAIKTLYLAFLSDSQVVKLEVVRKVVLLGASDQDRARKFLSLKSNPELEKPFRIRVSGVAILVGTANSRWEDAPSFGVGFQKVSVSSQSLFYGLDLETPFDQEEDEGEQRKAELGQRFREVTSECQRIIDQQAYNDDFSEVFKRCRAQALKFFGEAFFKGYRPNRDNATKMVNTSGESLADPNTPVGLLATFAEQLDDRFSNWSSAVAETLVPELEDRASQDVFNKVPKEYFSTQASWGQICAWLIGDSGRGMLEVRSPSDSFLIPDNIPSADYPCFGDANCPVVYALMSYRLEALNSLANSVGYGEPTRCFEISCASNPGPNSDIFIVSPRFPGPDGSCAGYPQR